MKMALVPRLPAIWSEFIGMGDSETSINTCTVTENFESGLFVNFLCGHIVDPLMTRCLLYQQKYLSACHDKTGFSIQYSWTVHFRIEIRIGNIQKAIGIFHAIGDIVDFILSNRRYALTRCLQWFKFVIQLYLICYCKYSPKADQNCPACIG